MDDKLGVATGQIQAFALARAEHGLQAVERMILAAAEQGADLLALPECAYPAYLIESEQVFRSADILPPDEYLIFLARWARKKRLHIVSGYIEDTHTLLYNGAVLIDAGGQVVGTYRKSFLWGADNAYFAPGERGGVFDTDLGPVGMVICADTRAPELVARQVLAGAGVIAMPTCWVNVAGLPDHYENPQPEYLIAARSREFGVPFVCANKFGMETDRIGYCGRSMITDARGAVLYEAPGTGEQLGMALIEPRDPDIGPAATDHWAELLHRETARRTEPVCREAVGVALCGGSEVGSATLAELAAGGVRLALARAVSGDAVLPEGLEVLTPAEAGRLTATGLGQVGCLDGRALSGFAAARLMALDGMELLCVFDPPEDAALLRTRAVENRVFVLAVGERLAAAIAPDGTVLEYRPAPDAAGVRLDINPADAAVKTVAPGTDIWEQRRVWADARP